MTQLRFTRSAEEHNSRILAAQQKALEASQRTSKATVEVGKEKIQFFEKVALGAGATLAAIISFVGTSPASIHNPALLKSSLGLLIFGLAGSMYRNWRYPFYTVSVWLRAEAAAKQQVERCEYEYFDDHSDVRIIEDGIQVTHEQWKSEYAERKGKIDEEIAKAIRHENRIFVEIQIVENASLIAIIIAIVLLTAVIWTSVGIPITPNTIEHHIAL